MQTIRVLLLEKAITGEKNNGFDVLYHNMKHGQISSKELTDFIRERSTIEEAYARSMTKLAKSAGNFSQLGTFAPVWDVVKTSTEKLASCHMELVRKLQELIKEVQKYVEEQAKAHKKHRHSASPSQRLSVTASLRHIVSPPQRLSVSPSQRLSVTASLRHSVSITSPHSLLLSLCTKEEVASTLEAVQNIQTTSQALQKSKEIYNAKTVEQERLRKEGATQRDVDKAGVKAKKATETYKSYVEKYAAAKSEFEQKMAETAQRKQLCSPQDHSLRLISNAAHKFQDIEENHTLHMKEIIQSYSQSVDETHVQIGERASQLHQKGLSPVCSLVGTLEKMWSDRLPQVQNEFVRNVENTSVDSLIQKLAESKGTGKERPGPIEFEECNTAIATEGAKPRKRKPFGIPGRRKDKDTDSTESTEVEAANTANGAPPGYYGAIDIQNANVPQVDAEGFCIRPKEMRTISFMLVLKLDSEDEDEPRKFHVEIKPVLPNNGTHQNRATIDELKASIGNISLSPSTSGQMRRNQSSDELAKPRVPTPYELTNNDLLSLDPFGPTLAAGSSSSVSSSTDLASIFLSIPPSPSFLMNDSEVFLPEASAEAVTQRERSPPLAESQQSKEVSSFSSSTSSPWYSPENPFQALKPVPARAQSAPITLPTEPIDPIRSPSAASPPKSGDAFSSVSWSQSQWIAFSDNLAPARRQGFSVKELQRPHTGPPRSTRCLSDDSADAYCKTSGSREDPRFTDVFSGITERAMAAAQTGKILNVPLPNRPTTPLTAGALVPPPRPSSRPKLPTGKLTGINEIVRPFSPPKTSNASPPPAAPLARAESSSSLSSNASLSAGNTPTVGAEARAALPLSFFPLSQKDDSFIAKLPTFEKRCETPAGTSRGPSPVTLASQDALPLPWPSQNRLMLTSKALIPL
ncbi:F-BAR domain only protein 2, partial [Dissostichus eleginoides]